MDVYAKIKLADSILDSSPQIYAFDKQPNNLSYHQGSATLRTEGLDAVTLTEEQTHGNGNLNFLNVLESEDGYDGYRFGVTDENGLYTLSLTVTSQTAGQNVYGIVVYGDEAADQRPVEADYIVTGSGDSQAVHISNANNVWAIMFKTPAPSVTVRFRSWSRPDYNACITHIEPLPQELVIDGARFKSIESTSQLCARTDEIAYGVLPGDGELEIYDFDGEIADYLKDGIIPFENAKIKIFAGGNVIQTLYATDSEYDDNDKTLKLSLSDELGKFDKIKFAGFGIRNNQSLWSVLAEIMASAGYSAQQLEKMCNSTMYAYKQFGYLTVAGWLQVIKVPHPYMEPCTLREAVNKVCQLAWLYCFCAPDGSIKFVSARPYLTDSGKALTLPQGHTYGPVKKSLFPKLLLNNVKVELTDFEREQKSIAKFDGEFSKKKEGVDTVSSSEHLEFVYPSLEVDKTEIFEDANKTYRVLYYEKSFSVTNMTMFENVRVEATVESIYQNGETFSISESKSTENVVFAKYNDAESFKNVFSTDQNGIRTLKADFPFNNQLILGYYVKDYTLTMMSFVVLYNTAIEKPIYVCKQNIDLTASVYKPVEITA